MFILTKHNTSSCLIYLERSFGHSRLDVVPVSICVCMCGWLYVYIYSTYVRKYFKNIFKYRQRRNSVNYLI